MEGDHPVHTEFHGRLVVTKRAASCSRGDPRFSNREEMHFAWQQLSAGDFRHIESRDIDGCLKTKSNFTCDAKYPQANVGTI